MDLVRKVFDRTYDWTKPFVFQSTGADPEKAHKLFVNFARFLDAFGLEKFVLNNRTNKTATGYELSNAAGFNKNGEIPPLFMRCLGFDRVVVGTVTYEPWKGNPKPRIWRFPKTASMVNCMGLPGIGAEEVAENLLEYGSFHEVPLTINLMATPGKTGDAALRDLKMTMACFRGFPCVDRFELNISCPNAHGSEGLDTRKEHQERLGTMLEVACGGLDENDELYIKVSPDIDEGDVKAIIETIDTGFFDVRGFTIANTTAKHDPAYVKKSPGKGGASGDAVYTDSLRVQKMFYDLTIDSCRRIIACGGINTPERVKERLRYGAEGIQVFTPLVFRGPRLLREFRENANRLIL